VVEKMFVVPFFEERKRFVEPVLVLPAERAGEKNADAVTDKGSHFLTVSYGKTECAKSVVHPVVKVGERFGEGSVKIKKNEP